VAVGADLGARPDGEPAAALRATRATLTAVAIQRLRQPPHPVTLATPTLTLYEVELSKAPSRAWRAAFLRLPAALKTIKRTPELGRLDLHGHRITFRTIPTQLHAWLRRIDRWIALAKKAKISRVYVNKLEEGRSDPTVGMLQRLAKALGVPVSELLA
jgi:hypothetical protein